MENRKNNVWDWIVGTDKTTPKEEPTKIMEYHLTKQRYTPLEVELIIKEVWGHAKNKEIGLSGIKITRMEVR